MISPRKRAGHRGSLIVAALLLFALLLSLGLGLMSSQSARMKAAQAQVDAIQAKSLALAAWADVKTKLGKDLFFPPVRDQITHFSYSEDVFNEVGGAPEFYGTYTVIIDTQYTLLDRNAPITTGAITNIHAGHYLITCIGKIGPRGEAPSAERVLQFELDVENFQVVRTHDLQGL